MKKVIIFLIVVLSSQFVHAHNVKFEVTGKSRGNCSEGSDVQKARAAVKQEATRICGTSETAYIASNYSESSEYYSLRCPPGHFNFIDVEVITSRAMFKCI